MRRVIDDIRFGLGELRWDDAPTDVLQCYPSAVRTADDTFTIPDFFRLTRSLAATATVRFVAARPFQVALRPAIVDRITSWTAESAAAERALARLVGIDTLSGEEQRVGSALVRFTREWGDFEVMIRTPIVVPERI